jgi:hypothetical protein
LTGQEDYQSEVLNGSNSFGSRRRIEFPHRITADRRVWSGIVGHNDLNLKRRPPIKGCVNNAIRPYRQGIGCRIFAGYGRNFRAPLAGDRRARGSPAAVEIDLEHAVDRLARWGQFVERGAEQALLQVAADIGQKNDEAGMQRLGCVELALLVTRIRSLSLA